MHHDPNPDDDPGDEIDALYQDLIRQHARDVFDQAAQTVANGDAIDDPTMLRIVFARLLLHETHPGNLAARAATLANAVARLTTAQRQQHDGDADLNAEVDALLAEFDAARATARTAREGASS